MKISYKFLFPLNNAGIKNALFPVPILSPLKRKWGLCGDKRKKPKKKELQQIAVTP